MTHLTQHVEQPDRIIIITNETNTKSYVKSHSIGDANTVTSENKFSSIESYIYMLVLSQHKEIFVDILPTLS